MLGYFAPKALMISLNEPPASEVYQTTFPSALAPAASNCSRSAPLYTASSARDAGFRPWPHALGRTPRKTRTAAHKRALVVFFFILASYVPPSGLERHPYLQTPRSPLFLS